jgi:hypothetical protein
VTVASTSPVTFDVDFGVASAVAVTFDGTPDATAVTSDAQQRAKRTFRFSSEAALNPIVHILRPSLNKKIFDTKNKKNTF